MKFNTSPAVFSLVATGAILGTILGTNELKQNGTSEESRNLISEIAGAEEELTGKTFGDYKVTVDGKKVDVKFDIPPIWNFFSIPSRKFEYTINRTNECVRAVISPYYPAIRVFAGKQEITINSPNYYDLKYEARRVGFRAMQEVRKEQDRIKAENLRKANIALRRW
jgi:hypothetical protein